GTGWRGGGGGSGRAGGGRGEAGGEDPVAGDAFEHGAGGFQAVAVFDEVEDGVGDIADVGGDGFVEGGEGGGEESGVPEAGGRGFPDGGAGEGLDGGDAGLAAVA